MIAGGCVTDIVVCGVVEFIVGVDVVAVGVVVVVLVVVGVVVVLVDCVLALKSWDNTRIVHMKSFFEVLQVILWDGCCCLRIIIYLYNLRIKLQNLSTIFFKNIISQAFIISK